MSTYQNLRFIFSCGRGRPQGQRQDNWIPEMVTWQLISVSQSAERSLVLEDRSLLLEGLMGVAHYQSPSNPDSLSLATCRQLERVSKQGRKSRFDPALQLIGPPFLAKGEEGEVASSVLKCRCCCGSKNHKELARGKDQDGGWERRTGPDIFKRLVNQNDPPWNEESLQGLEGCC